MVNLFKGKLIVSCQALKDEPLHSSFIMGRMALAAKEGGAVAIRANGVEDINEIKRVTGLPIIGIIKRDYNDSDIYITASSREVNELLETDAEIIALDCTNRKRPNNENIADLIEVIHSNGRLVMADISTYEEGIKASELGVDIISTTLSGYTPYSPKLNGPDYELVYNLTKDVQVPVFCEGRINTPEDAKRAFDFGAYSIIVGGAITRPKQITERFVKGIN
ncbi:N-acetylmannosamine-6-phosphate 2-epimerase [Clostridium sp. NSJ-145]|uniref:N-acetylmannosamine-6-phosphate 2-epimerase n=1 Tax=Clostridium sp. NSJ-145 TaxID=2897777 RepID=UPI001E420CB4|nr:N-acetylmannosamine-6-phosphate 2-epimerase [Clostridium sp. NSJ-145]MCD2501600.1 N-acetylmannosamine-6-phosphate 2-epimerase [Clostridium sp. NSJ-145]